MQCKDDKVFPARIFKKSEVTEPKTKNEGSALFFEAGPVAGISVGKGFSRIAVNSPGLRGMVHRIKERAWIQYQGLPKTEHKTPLPCVTFRDITSPPSSSPGKQPSATERFSGDLAAAAVCLNLQTATHMDDSSKTYQTIISK